MLSQVERGETSPTLVGRLPDRHRARAHALPAAPPRRGRRGDRGPRRGAPRRRRHRARPRLRDPHAAAAGQRAELSLHTLAPGAATGGPSDPPMHEPGSRETAVVTRASCGSSATAPRTTWPRVTRSRSTRTCRTTSRTPAGTDARFLAVVAAGLRRSLMAKTMLDKIWERHEVHDELLYIDLHLVHEVTSAQAFESLRLAGRKVRRPDRTLATADHNVPTDGAMALPMVERPALAQADRHPRGELRRVRHPDPLDRLGPPGHRPRDRAGAGRHPARHDDRLRGLAHLHPRRLRRAGVRDRHERGRARARHADAAAAQAALDAHLLLRRAAARRHGQGPDPRHDRPDRRGRRRGPRDRVLRARRSRASRWRAG